MISEKDVFSASFNIGKDLNGNQIEMPLLGLGVYQIRPGSLTENAVSAALDIGYRLVDTAALYGNEADVGKAVRKYLDSNPTCSREDLFITTKVWNDAHGFENTIKACENSLRKLKMKYIDLYLIHSPYKGKIIETYEALLKLQKMGKVRAIGVSNFGIPHLKALQSKRLPMPAVNQIEMHPGVWKKREKLVKFCRKNGIVVTAYGSLMVGNGKVSISEDQRGQSKAIDDVIFQIAEAKKQTPAQILLKWGMQMGFALIPKSKSADRIEENSKLYGFELSESEMKIINSMSPRTVGYWNPLKAKVDL